MRLESRSVVTLLAILGIGLGAATVPLWLGEALFCDDSELYCGVGWLVLGLLGLVVVGGIGARLGEGWAGLVVGLVGVMLGTYIALQRSNAENPYLPFTWELYSGWVMPETAAYGIGYVVVWGAVAILRDARR